jgi:hypothetical protein
MRGEQESIVDKNNGSLTFYYSFQDPLISSASKESLPTLF